MGKTFGSFVARIQGSVSLLKRRVYAESSVSYGRARTICVEPENPVNAWPPDNKIAAAILLDLKTSV
jgi:hypothetical protein